MELKRVEIDVFEGMGCFFIGMVPIANFTTMISPWDDFPEWEGEVIMMSKKRNALIYLNEETKTL